MTVPTKSGVILARVTSKLRTSDDTRGTNWVYNLSTGHKIRLKTDDLDLKKWYFFELKVNALKQASFVSYEPLPTELADSADKEIYVAKQAVYKAVAMWRKLEASDRAILMRELGIGLAAAAGIGTAINGASALIEGVVTESIFGIATGGFGLAISAALGTISFLQYEERKEALKLHAQTFNSYRKARDIMARSMIRLLPSRYAHLEVLNPDVQSIVTQLKLIIDDFEASDLFAYSDTSYAYQAA